MMLNEILIQWVWVNVTTKALLVIASETYSVLKKTFYGKCNSELW